MRICFASISLLAPVAIESMLTRNRQLNVEGALCVCVMTSHGLPSQYSSYISPEAISLHYYNIMYGFIYVAIFSITLCGSGFLSVHPIFKS